MTNTATAARQIFRVKGTTNDVTTCELCGRDELKGTVVLEILDTDGTGTGDLVHYGVSCGAKAAGWTSKDIRTAAKTADTERRAAQLAAFSAAHDAWCALRDAWIAENIGPDALDRPRKYGFTGPAMVVQAFREATGNLNPVVSAIN